MPVKRKELISSVGLWAAMFLYMSADAMTAPIGAPAGNQSWISIIIATFIAMGVTWVFTYLSDTNSGKCIVDISDTLLGKWGGKLSGLLYAWVGYELASYNLKNNWQMTATVALPNTPIVVLAITAMIFAVWIAYGGIETISRLSTFFVPIFVFYLGMAFILLSKDFDFRNFLPLADIQWRKVLYSSLQVATLPLGHAVIFTMFFPSLNKTGQARKPSFYAIVSTGLLVLLSDILYLLVLGSLGPKLTYPGYSTFSYIEVGDFIDRAEILFYSVFIAINIVEISVSLFVSALCLAKVLGVKNHRVFVVPLGFLVLEQSLFIVKNHAEHITIAIYVWPWYASIYQFLIPLGLLILSAIRKKTRGNNCN